MRGKPSAPFGSRPHVIRDVRLQRGRRLDRHMPGDEMIYEIDSVTAVWVGRLALRRPWTAAWKKRLVGRRFEAVRRRGKWIVLELDGGGRLVFHLGMTGQLTAADADALILDHTHLKFGLDGGAS